MKIVIDGRMYGPRRWTGIGRYLQHLLRQLEQLDHENEYVVLVGEENFDDYTPRAPNFRKVLSSAKPYGLAEQTRLTWQLWRLRPDLVHFPAPNSPLLYRGRRVTTVHDLTLLFYSTARGTGAKKWLREAKRWPFRAVLWTSVHARGQVMTPTEFVKQQLIERYHLDGGRVSSALLGIDLNSAEPEAVPGVSAPDPYVLYVGNCYPYKNVDRLAEALKKVVQLHPDLKFVMVGRDDYFRELFKEKIRDLALDDRTVYTGPVSDGQLRWLYRHAKLYVNPSLSEGFGLQGLEAMVSGVPVVAARASCLPEVYGEAALYFAPDDTEGLAHTMLQALDDGSVRKQMVARGKQRVKEFSWQLMAEKTLEAYRVAGR